jgi:hypothetical protein
MFALQIFYINFNAFTFFSLKKIENAAVQLSYFVKII